MDWFDAVTTAAIVALGVGAIAYYTRQALRTRRFTKETSGQIMVAMGFLVLVLTPKVYTLTAEAQDSVFAVALVLIVSGFALGSWHDWRTRKQTGRHAADEP